MEDHAPGPRTASQVPSAGRVKDLTPQASLAVLEKLLRSGSDGRAGQAAYNGKVLRAVAPAAERSTLAHAPEVKAKAPRLQGGKPAGLAVLPELEEKKTRAWQRQLWAKVRSTISEAVAKKSALLHIKPSSPDSPAPPAGGSTSAPTRTTPAVIFSLNPWQRPFVGETLTTETLAVLAAPAESVLGKGDKPIGKSLPAEPRVIEARQNSLPCGVANGPDNVSVSVPQPAPGAARSRAGSLSPAVFDRPLRELLQQARSKEGGLQAEAFPGLHLGSPGAVLPDMARHSSGQPAKTPDDIPAGPPSTKPQGVEPQKPQPGEQNLERLTEQLQRILQDEARRHGIDL